MSAGVKEEAEKIYELLRNHIPSEWDGKKAILELKEADFIGDIQNGSDGILNPSLTRF